MAIVVVININVIDIAITIIKMICLTIIIIRAKELLSSHMKFQN